MKRYIRSSHTSLSMPKGWVLQTNNQLRKLGFEVDEYVEDAKYICEDNRVKFLGFAIPEKCLYDEEFEGELAIVAVDEKVDPPELLVAISSHDRLYPVDELNFWKTILETTFDQIVLVAYTFVYATFYFIYLNV